MNTEQIEALKALAEKARNTTGKSSADIAVDDAAFDNAIGPNTVLALIASATASEARIAEQVEESYRKGWGEGMQEAAALIASDDSCNVLAKLESDLAALLDVPYYMDPPDGGSVTLIEQVRRMAEDAKRYRWLRDSGPEGKPAVMIEGRWYGAKHGNGVGFDLDSAIDAALAGSATPSPYLQQEVSPEILGAVARGWCSPENSHKVMDSTLAVAIAREVEAMLTAVHDAAFTNGAPQDTLKNADSGAAGLPAELSKAFITLESSGGEGRTIVLKFNQREDAYAVHEFLLKGGA